MKQGWEIKKLGEVCEVIGGSTPKTSDDTFWDGDYYWISPAELDGSKYVYSTTRTITDAGVRSAHLQILPIGTVLLSSRAPIGKVAITKVPMYCNQGFKNLVCGKDLINEYVYWFLKHNTDYLNSLGTGATFKEISKKVVEQIPIPVPPIAEQEKIVAELDCLSGIIEKKKQQLKELDNLAQSIFYEMFGDPVENDKGWETKKVIDVVKLQRGYDLPIQHRQSDGGIPVWGSNGIVGWHNEAKVDYGVITGRSGTLGTVYSYDKPFFPLNTTLFSVNTHGNDIVYLKYLLNIFDLKRFGTGTGVPTLNRNVFHSEPIISVPLALQQDFASKIEAIEKQKELIKQSIKETETLFNSRMDYYFN